MAHDLKIPKSFTVDHRKMAAPQVRKVCVTTGPDGGTITKFDLRFVKPNVEVIPTAAIHTLEHLLAAYLRQHLDGVIDISPMGCRTGFYLLMWGNVDAMVVKEVLLRSLHQVMEIDWDDVPGISEEECGNYRDHSLTSAREYARIVLNAFGTD